MKAKCWGLPEKHTSLKCNGYMNVRYKIVLKINTHCLVSVAYEYAFNKVSCLFKWLEGLKYNYGAGACQFYYTATVPP